ncbi:MAG TPA: hypothetical protein VFH18_06910 [Erysipelotrichaceae bacterium]|nr:hypothetical protein [Erysipelotrichaceae bacterium]
MILKKFAFISLNLLFGIIIALISYVLIQYSNGSITQLNRMPISNWIIFVILIIVIYLLYNFTRKIKLNINEKQTTLILLIAAFILFLIQIFIAYQIYFYTGWDASAVRNAAFYFIEHPDKIAKYFNYYFSYHVNQTSITILLGYIMKFFHQLGIANYYFGTVVFSVLSVNLSGLFLALNLNKLIKNKIVVFIGFGLFTILCSISPWITIPYSDTLMMLFPSIALFVYLHLKGNYWDILYWTVIFTSVFIGSLIKPQSLIMGIAIVLFEFVIKRKVTIKQEFIRFVIITFVGIITFISTNAIQKTLVELGQFKQNPELAFTIPHYLMVGLNLESYGTYTSEDAEISYGQFTIVDRETKNWEVIQSRVNYLNENGWINFLVNKAVINFNDGSFAWGMEGDFYQKLFDRDSSIAETLRNYYYHDGSYFDYFLLLKQFVWISIIILMCMQILIKDKEDEVYLLYIICIGIILFNMIFEARARYLFAFIPYFIMVASFTLDKLSSINLTFELDKNNC